MRGQADDLFLGDYNIYSEQPNMSRTLIENSRIWHNESFISGHTLIIADGIISDIRPATEVHALPGDRRMDGKGCYALPGFVDLHVHGSNGFDAMDATEDALQGMCDFLVQQGVTSFLPTTMSASTERITAALLAMEAFAARPHTPCLGVHLEGPYLNRDYRGAQPDRYLRSPRRDEYLRWFETGQVKLITMAAELEGGRQLIRDAKAHQVTVSLGHSGASYEQAQDAFAIGLRQITHTFNGMAGIHHRQPGLFVAAIENPQVTFQIIPDGVHLHPAIVRMMIRLAGRERVLVITDAMRAAGLADGAYSIGDVAVIVKNGEARTRQGGLAGSTLGMSQAVGNMMRFCDLTLAEAIPMLARVPARSIGMYPQKGSLDIGSDADIVIWDDASGVQATLIGGEPVYQTAAMKW